MTLDEILGTFRNAVQSYSPSQIMAVLLAALAGGMLIYVTYRFTTDAAIYNRNLNIGNVVIALITAVIMLMISSNVVITLGMVGALSIVRFRTAIKEPRDTVFIFWAIVLGLCTGSQNFTLAGLSSLTICVILFLFSLPVWGKAGSYTLIVQAQSEGGSEGIDEVIRQHARSARLRAAHTAGDSMELVYKLRIGRSKTVALVQTLRGQEGVRSANIAESDNI